jgi:branched-chain amino acid transport system ATP-binding protein
MSLLDVSEIDTYYGESHVLYDLSLDVDEGEVVALLGRNGAGKTTTVRSITGLTPPRRGTITFRGAEMTGRSPEEISRAGISLVPEDRGIIPHLMVRENLQLGGYAHGRGSTEDIEAICSYFPALEDLLDGSAGNLSGGEQQMLAVGRGLLAEPDLLILDEPSEGLAPVIVESLVDIIEQINDEGTSILLIEQSLEVALELADRVFVIENGQNVYRGDVDEFKERRDMILGTLGVSQEVSDDG